MPYSLACVQVIIPNMAVFDCLESSFKDNNITLSDCLTNTQIKSWCDCCFENKDNSFGKFVHSTVHGEMTAYIHTP